MTDQTAKKRENKVLRRNEYYAIQDVFDSLYAKSKQGAIFTDLMSLIASPQNIALAYRRIKRNKGSRTSGTNMGTIEQIAERGNDVLVDYVQQRLTSYKPHPVRRVMIPKDNGKERPLGIPTIEDRLIQQCILQVMEPICEAKFHKHSYGFRPNRNTHHAISRFRFLAFTVKLEYVVDIDIKGFFDNVDHPKLLKQIWSLGIHDKNLLCVISKLRKALWDARGNEDKARNLNMKIRGMHNYYCVATRVSNDFWEIYYRLLKTLKHITRSHGKIGPPLSEFQKRRYGNYHGRRYLVGSVVIDPIYAVTFTIPYGFKQETCNYTEEGRQLIHKRLTHLEVIFRYLAEHPLQHETIELNDNRISRMSAQGGKCAITKKQLTVYDMRVHKIYPNGGDGYRNIDIVSRDAHELIHTKDMSRAEELIQKLLGEELWNEKALKKTNNYRMLVGNAIIE